MPRKNKPENGVLFEPPKDDLSAKPSAQHSTREIWRFIRFYCKEVRQHAAEECKGVIRQIQRLIDKGISLDEVATALENYAADEWRRSQDPRYSKHIRSFFTKEIIQQWQTPRPPIRPVKPLADMNLTPDTPYYPTPAQPITQPDEDADDL